MNFCFDSRTLVLSWVYVCRRLCCLFSLALSTRLHAWAPNRAIRRPRRRFFYSFRCLYFRHFLQWVFCSLLVHFDARLCTHLKKYSIKTIRRLSMNIAANDCVAYSTDFDIIIIFSYIYVWMFIIILELPFSFSLPLSLSPPFLDSLHFPIGNCWVVCSRSLKRVRLFWFLLLSWFLRISFDCYFCWCYVML